MVSEPSVFLLQIHSFLCRPFKPQIFHDITSHLRVVLMFKQRWGAFSNLPPFSEAEMVGGTFTLQGDYLGKI